MCLEIPPVDATVQSSPWSKIELTSGEPVVRKAIRSLSGDHANDQTLRSP
jgi:hypothetical protein